MSTRLPDRGPRGYLTRSIKSVSRLEHSQGSINITHSSKHRGQSGTIPHGLSSVYLPGLPLPHLAYCKWSKTGGGEHPGGVATTVNFTGTVVEHQQAGVYRTVPTPRPEFSSQSQWAQHWAHIYASEQTSRIQRVVSGQQQDTEGRQWAGKTSQLQASSSIQSYVYILSTQPKTRNSVKQASWLKWPNMCKDWLALSASVVPLHCLAVSAVFLANRAHILPPGDKAIQPADTRSASNTHSDLVQ